VYLFNRALYKELKAKLKAAERKLKVYDELIEVTNRELDSDIVKKSRPGCPRIGNKKNNKYHGCMPVPWAKVSKLTTNRCMPEKRRCAKVA
jgi:hypothetical protein